MVGVDGGCRVNLQTVVVLAGVLKQTVHGVQHLMGQQEEPFPVAEREQTERALEQDPPGQQVTHFVYMKLHTPQQGCTAKI